MQSAFCRGCLAGRTDGRVGLGVGPTRGFVMSRRSRAFTLVELLVVIVIMVLLIALLPALEGRGCRPAGADFVEHAADDRGGQRVRGGQPRDAAVPPSRRAPVPQHVPLARDGAGDAFQGRRLGALQRDERLRSDAGHGASDHGHARVGPVLRRPAHAPPNRRRRHVAQPCRQPPRHESLRQNLDGLQEKPRRRIHGLLRRLRRLAGRAQTGLRQTTTTTASGTSPSTPQATKRRSDSGCASRRAASGPTGRRNPSPLCARRRRHDARRKAR